MKKILVLFCALLFSTLIMAQDACAELMSFNDYKKNANRTSRMISKTEKTGQTQTMERDKEGNIRQLMTVNARGQSMTVESIVVGSKMYVRKNDLDWQSPTLDSVQLAILKNKWQNNKVQFFKNCQKLDNETINGKTYRIYTGDFDGEKMKKVLSTTKDVPNLDAVAKMEMKMKFYINEKDDVEKTILNVSYQGQSYDSEMVFEYDMPLVVCVPELTPAEKKK
jgi:hypothetical protein